MSKKLKNVCWALNYIEQLYILASAVAGCVSICAFALSAGILVGIASSVVGFKNSAITARVKKYKPIIKKKKTEYDKIVR